MMRDITIRNCMISNCGGGIRVDGHVDGLSIDGLTVVDTPYAIGGTGRLTNSAVKGVVHHPVLARKIGRNDPCWCGSGLKFKKCCLR